MDIHNGFKSEIGLAVAMLPPSVATLRICSPANQRNCSVMALKPLVAYVGFVVMR